MTRITSIRSFAASSHCPPLGIFPLFHSSSACFTGRYSHHHSPAESCIECTPKPTEIRSFRFIPLAVQVSGFTFSSWANASESDSRRDVSPPSSREPMSMFQFPVEPRVTFLVHVTRSNDTKRARFSYDAIPAEQKKTCLECHAASNVPFAVDERGFPLVLSRKKERLWPGANSLRFSPGAFRCR